MEVKVEVEMDITPSQFFHFSLFTFHFYCLHSSTTFTPSLHRLFTFLPFNHFSNMMKAAQ